MTVASSESLLVLYNQNVSVEYINQGALRGQHGQLLDVV